MKGRRSMRWLGLSTAVLALAASGCHTTPPNGSTSSSSSRWPWSKPKPKPDPNDKSKRAPPDLSLGTGGGTLKDVNKLGTGEGFVAGYVANPRSNVILSAPRPLADEPQPIMPAGLSR